MKAGDCRRDSSHRYCECELRESEIPAKAEGVQHEVWEVLKANVAATEASAALVCASVSFLHVDFPANQDERSL